MDEVGRRLTDRCRRRQPTATGRSLPTADVGSPVAQLGGQLSGGEIAHPAVAGRPTVDVAVTDLASGNLPLDVTPR